MNAPKCSAVDPIDFLVVSARAVSGTEAARAQPPRPRPPAHDAFTRLLHRLEPDAAALWAEAEPLVRRDRGILVLDDSTRATPHARKMALVTRHWSGTHRRVVAGIHLLTLLGTDGAALIPVDYRVYGTATDGLTKNDHSRAMLATAEARGFAPECVAFDRWDAGPENREAVRGCGWRWLTQLKSNRLVNPDGTGNRPLGECAVAATGTRLRLQGYGFIRVFRTVPPDGDAEQWATDDLARDEVTRLKHAEWAWGSEQSHRGLKQECGGERARVRAADAQRAHIGRASRAFLRFEQHRLVTGVRWGDAKTAIIRAPVRAYLAAPRYTLASTPTA